MSTKRKVLISLVLIISVTLSVVMSFNIVARDTYEFTPSEEYGGYEFDGFSGKQEITVVDINERLEKQKTLEGEEWLPVEGDYITSIDEYTIISDEYVTEINIGAHVKNIDECAFVYCKQLEKINVDPANENYVDVDGVLYTKNMKTLITYPVCHKVNGENAEEYAVPDTVTRIADNAFYKCENLKKVTLSKNLKEIGRMAFFKCTNLERIELPNGVNFIDCDAFSYCTAMKYAMFIPSSVKEIGHHCFYKCDALEQFYVESAEADITLGGKWMPKSENSFAAEDANFSASKADYDAYVAKRTEEDYVPPVEGEEQAEEETASGMNKTAVIIMIVLVFIPCFSIVAIEVIRNLFKDDFLMTKKGKEKLKKRKEEKEAIHMAYVNGEFEPAEIPEENSGEEDDD